MALQPASRRLVTEAALTTALGPMLSEAELTALRGVSSGLATLGSDGLVSPAQLPAGLVPVMSRLAADAALANATTDIPGWSVPLTPGLWFVEAFGTARSNSTASSVANLYLVPAAGLAFTVPSAQARLRAGLNGTPSTPGLTTAGTAAVKVGDATGGSTFYPFDLDFYLQVTTAGTLQARGNYAVASGSIGAMSTIRATKVA